MAILSVGSGKAYTSIATAVAAAKNGDTVAVQAGTYLNDYATIRTRISLVAVGGTVTMQSTTTAAPAAALLTVSANATVTGFAFSGMRTTAGTGAGILLTAGNLVVANSLFTGNQDGILTQNNATASLQVSGSEFAGNGNSDGFSHNVAVGGIASLTIQDSYIHDAEGGSEVRSLAASTTITGTRIQDNAAASLYALDLSNGGTVSLQNDVIEKGAASTATASIRFGGGTVASGSALSLSGTTVVSDRAGATLLQNQTTAIANLTGTTTYGYAALSTGPAVVSGTIVDAARPSLSTAAIASPVPASGGLAANVSYGRAGAVVASGHVLKVGAGQQYGTVAAAVAASVDGDTIDVAAGTYVNDGAVITHKVIIEGVGGIARFVDTVAPAGGAVFATSTDVTFRNIEVFGVGTAIRVQGGNTTVVNSTLHDNAAGIVVVAAAGGSVAGSLGVFDTEIAANGTNVSVGEIAAVTLQNDYVHGGKTGPEIASTADNTALDGVRVVQDVSTGPAVTLADGGTASIANSAIEVARGPAVQVGGGSVHAGSTVTLSNDVLINDAAAVAALVVNTSSVAAVTVTGSSFQNAAAVPVQGGTNTGASSVSGLAADKASPWAAGGAPGAAQVTMAAPGAAQPGQLVLFASGASYQGDAKFTVLVDGAAVGGTLSAVASHAAGQTEMFVIAGSYAPGGHTVQVSFTNSLGSRSLFIDGLTFNGVSVGAPSALVANGTTVLVTGPVVSHTAVAVNLSETVGSGAAGSAALAFISIDGKVQGGVQSITASHVTGHSQAMTFLVDLAPGAHTASVTFLNPGAGRALFVDSIDVGAAHYGAAAANLSSAASSAFAFTVAAPPAANGALFVTSMLPQDVGLVLPHA